MQTKRTRLKVVLFSLGAVAIALAALAFLWPKDPFRRKYDAINEGTSWEDLDTLLGKQTWNLGSDGSTFGCAWVNETGEFEIIVEWDSYGSGNDSIVSKEYKKRGTDGHVVIDSVNFRRPPKTIWEKCTDQVRSWLGM